MNTSNHRLPNYQNQRYQLVRQASAFLRQHGLSIRGRPLEVENWQQEQFEARMQRGAYRQSGESRRGR